MASKNLICLAILTLAFYYIKAAPNFRIYGGQEAKPGQFPYQIALYHNGSFWCGGSILNENFILTAGHCVADDIQLYKVVVGITTLSAGGEFLNLKRIIEHPNRTLFNDVALIELEQPLKWSKFVQPIELPTEDLPVGAEMEFYGWGRTPTGIPDHLMWTTAKRMSTEDCQESFPDGSVDNSLICMDRPEGQGSCFGDSGGPAIYQDKVVGISNFIQSPCGSKWADKYANVFFFRKWILENMKS